MKAYGYAARTHHAVHALAVAGDPGLSGSPPHDERCARDRLGRVHVARVERFKRQIDFAISDLQDRVVRKGAKRRI